MILTVHDELLFEAPREAADETVALVREQMERAVTLKVPLDGRRWSRRELEGSALVALSYQPSAVSYWLSASSLAHASG